MVDIALGVLHRLGNIWRSPVGRYADGLPPKVVSLAERCTAVVFAVASVCGGGHPQVGATGRNANGVQLKAVSSVRRFAMVKIALASPCRDTEFWGGTKGQRCDA